MPAKRRGGDEELARKEWMEEWDRRREQLKKRKRRRWRKDERKDLVMDHSGRVEGRH